MWRRSQLTVAMPGIFMNPNGRGASSRPGTRHGTVQRDGLASQPDDGFAAEAASAESLEYLSGLVQSYAYYEG
jgi:hypothetical protein